MYYCPSVSSRAATIFHVVQPGGRKRVAQCASTGRKMVPPQPRAGAEEPTRRSFLTPRPGAAKRARLLPTAVRRGLLSCALRALSTVPFAACPTISAVALALPPHQIGRASCRERG